MSNLFNEMNSCRKCTGPRYGKSPFVFQIKKQRVMLISACPTIEAIFRPLTSIRFFRHVCVALFGENVCDEWLTAFNDDIYWTHLNKCHNEKVFIDHNFDLLPETCAKTWLDKEIDRLKPEFVIILGSLTAKRILKDELKSIDPAELCRIRNHIAHNNGYISPAEVPEVRNDFNGIRAFINMVHISEKGLESVEKYRQDITAILEQIYRYQQAQLNSTVR